MSLFSKFTSLFVESETTLTKRQLLKNELLEVFEQILNPGTKFNLKENTDLLAQFLMESEDHISVFFHFLETMSPDFNPNAIIQLLAVVHQLLKYDEINLSLALEIRGASMPWMQNTQQICQTEPEATTTRSTVRLNTEIDCQEPNSLFIYAQKCYGYIQRIALNLDLYKSVLRNQYPYVRDQDDVEPKLMFLWNYKIQNIMNYACQLLQYDQQLFDIQQAIYSDMYRFQYFVCKSITKVIELYAVLPNSDSLSLYENFDESNRHFEILNNFHKKAITSTKTPIQCQIQNTFLQEFLQFISKLKVLNQFAFKKSIKVPNKNNPCMGMQSKATNIIHLKTESGNLKSNDSSSEEEIDELASFEASKKPKRLFLKGQSTFQY